jgi:hypothetical protein
MSQQMKGYKMTESQLAKWKTKLTDQQYACLITIFNNSVFGYKTRYRCLFDVCNSPTKRISEMVERGVKFKTNWVRIRNSTGRLVWVEEFMV